ncbi:MAG: hypothetical protein IKA84_03260 [Clostridia bacterium]|nr:hypothetical protein [Clostridia bacterium]
MKQLTFKQYRQIDLTILCLLTAVFEAIATYSSNYWLVFQAMTISVTLTVTCITMVRWNGYAIAPALVGSFVYCLVSGASPKQFFIYCFGSAFCLFSLLLFKKFRKENINSSFAIRLAFVLSTYLFIALGRWICSLPFEFSLGSILAFIFTDVLSLIFAIFVLTLAKNADGLIEDQKSYLLRLEKKRLEEQEANLNHRY